MVHHKKEEGFVSMLGLLLSIAIIFFLAYKMYTNYFTKPLLDTQTQKAVSGQGINTSNPQTIVQSTRDSIKGIEKKMQDQQKEYLGGQ